MPLIDTPFKGEIKGKKAFTDFVADYQKWLQEYKTKPETFAITVTEQRICVEFILYLEYEGKDIDLPVAIMADHFENKISAIRVYHSTWQFTGKHRIRSPLLKPVENIDEPEIIKRYT
jgi:hypothetical protein